MKEIASYAISNLSIFSFKTRYAPSVAQIGSVKKMHVLVETGIYLSAATLP